MHLVTRRGAALLAASATLGTAVVTPIATASAAPPVQTRGLLDPVTTLLAALTNPAAVQGLLTTFGLTAPAQLAQLLQAANATQLATLLDGLNAAQLQGALGALNAAQLQALLGQAGAGDLAGIFALLSPAQITGLAGAGGIASGAAGLQALLSSLTGGGTSTPLPAPLGDLVAQVTALLGATPTGSLSQLDPLLTALAPVLGTAGLDPTQLTALTAAVTKAAQSGDITGGLGAVAGALGLLGGGSTTQPGGGTTTTPGGGGSTTTTPGGGGSTTTTPGGSGNTTTTAVKRVKVRRIKVAANHKSAKVTLRSAGAASAVVSGTVGSKSAFKSRTVQLSGGKVVLKVKLAKKARKGTLKISVATVGASKAATKRVKIK